MDRKGLEEIARAILPAIAIVGLWRERDRLGNDDVGRKCGSEIVASGIGVLPEWTPVLSTATSR